MFNRLLTSIASLAVASAVIGCRAEPIPLVVRAGTSMTVMLVGEHLAGDEYTPATRKYVVGFGGTLYWDQNVVDVQRGEMLFKLSKGGDEVELETQLVTRVFADPASDVALENGASYPPMLSNLGMGQTLAVVYVPPDSGGQLGNFTLPDDLYLSAHRVRRASADDDDPEVLEGEIYGEWITVLPGDGWVAPNDDNVSYLGSGGQALTADVYPHPKLVVNLPTYRYPDPADPYDPIIGPAAAHLEIVVPDTLDVLGVIEDQHFGRSSVVTWRAEEHSPGISQLVTIDLVNTELLPEVLTLAIVYEPELGAYVPVVDNDDIPNYFSVDSAGFWDQFGSELSQYTEADVRLGPIR